MGRLSEVETNLRKVFSVTRLDVRDDSEAHRGHGGFQEGGESHLHLVLASPDFKGMTRVARQRAVHAAIGPELMGEIHALSMELSED